VGRVAKVVKKRRAQPSFSLKARSSASRTYGKRHESARNQFLFAEGESYSKDQLGPPNIYPFPLSSSDRNSPHSLYLNLVGVETRRPFGLQAPFRLAMTAFPITSRSIFVLKKQSNASLGLQTTGSFSLNDVFSTIGMPVRARKLSISR
jgi:hypothetical protein